MEVRSARTFLAGFFLAGAFLACKRAAATAPSEESLGSLLVFRGLLCACLTGAFLATFLAGTFLAGAFLACGRTACAPPSEPRAGQKRHLDQPADPREFCASLRVLQACAPASS